jgi:hypothetical protein
LLGGTEVVDIVDQNRSQQCGAAEKAARLVDFARITELEVCVEPIGLLTFQRLRTNVARDSMPDDSRRSISVPSSLSWFSRRILLWRKLNLTNQKMSARF